jgi:hypothetical protein
MFHWVVVKQRSISRMLALLGWLEVICGALPALGGPAVLAWPILSVPQGAPYRLLGGIGVALAAVGAVVLLVVAVRFTGRRSFSRWLNMALAFPGLGSIAYGILLFLSSPEGSMSGGIYGTILICVGVGSIPLCLAGGGLIRRKRYGRWLNIALALLLIALIVCALWPIESGDLGDLSLVIPLVVLIAVMFLPCVRSEFAGRRRDDASGGLLGADHESG